MADILRIMDYINQQGEAGRQSGLARLVGKAYNANPQDRQALLGLAASRGAPDLAMNAQKSFDAQDENVHLQMAKRAAEVVALYKANPQMAQQVYQNGLLPIAARAGVNNAPPMLDDSLIPGLEKLASAATIGSTAGGVQSTYIDANGNRIAILRNGQTQVLGPNAPNNQIIDTGNGFYGVNKGNLQANPVMVGGGQPQAPSGYINTPSGPVNIDPSLPPEIRAQIAANPDQFMQPGTVQGAPIVQDGPAPQPSGALPPPLDYQNGGQLRSVPKPAAQSELEKRIALARQMGASDEEVRSMVMGGSYGTAPVPGDPTKTGEAYLATLPPEMRPVVKAIAEGRQAPPSASSRSPQAQQILQAVYAYDQTANATNLPARTATRKDFTSGRSYRNMLALNQVAAHLEQLSGQVGKVAGHSIPGVGNYVNAAENAFDRVSGKPGIIDWESTADAVAHETRALFAGSGSGTLQELEGYLRTLSANNSEEQKRAAIRNIANLVKSRIGILNDAYRQGMGTTADPFQTAFPHAADALNNLTTGGSPQASSSGGLSPAEQQELDALRKRFGR